MPSLGTSPNSAREDHDHGPIDNPRKTVIRDLVNNAGSDIDWGDVVKQDTTLDDAFTTNTTLAFSAGWLGVAQAPIGSNTRGPVLLSGYTPVINVGSNSTTRGQFLYGSNMARRAFGSNSRTTGAFGQALSTGVAPDAIIWPVTDGSGGGGGGSTAYSGAGAYNSSDLAINTGAETALTLNAEAFDTDGYHDTVTNTSRLTVPAGKDGYFLWTVNIRLSANVNTYFAVRKNGAAGTILGISSQTVNNSSTVLGLIASGVVQLVATDYIEVYALAVSAVNAKAPGAGPTPWFSISRLGT